MVKCDFLAVKKKFDKNHAVIFFIMDRLNMIMLNFSKEMIINLKTPSLNFHFKTDNLMKFCYFFLHFFRVLTHLPTERQM